MTSNPTRVVEVRWALTTLGLTSLLAATWGFQTETLSANFRLIPKLALLLPVDDQPWLCLAITAAVFTALSCRVLQGRFQVTRATTVTLVVLNAFLILNLGQQLRWGYREAYRILWLPSILTVAFELAVLGLLWTAWLIARRQPSLAWRTCLNWLLSFYVVSVWCGSGVSLVGP